MEQNKLLKVILLSLSVLAGTALIIWLALLGGKSVGNTTIEIKASPADASITLDGQPAKTGKISVGKGNHTIKATRQHFKDDSKDFDTRDLGDGNTVIIALVPSDDEGQAYLDKHPEEIMLRERLSGDEFTATQTGVVQEHPIVQELPYETIDYKINYTLDKDKNLTFEITLYPVATQDGSAEEEQQINQMKNSALQFLRRNNVDPDKEKINYVVER